MSEVHEAIAKWADRLIAICGSASSGASVSREMRAWLKSPAADFVAVPMDLFDEIRESSEGVFAEDTQYPKTSFVKLLKRLLACAEPVEKKDEILEALRSVRDMLRSSHGFTIREIVDPAIDARKAELKARKA